MIKKLPIRLRLTILNVLLLTVCCVGLTIILNFSANRMADVIEASPITPANPVGDYVPWPTTNSGTMMEPLTPSATSQTARKNFLNQSIFYMVAIVAFGGFLTYIISGKALKPLHELSIQMKNRTVHNLSEQLEFPPTKDEIADLTCSFNEMSQKLDDAFSMQKRFSQSAAHELRTPLTVLKTKVAVFKKKEGHTPEEYDRLLDIIDTHTNRLSDLVKDLLSFMNMDEMDRDQEITLKHVLEDIIQELSGLADSKNVSISISGTEQAIYGNKMLLHRAFYNLVENAIKYNVNGGFVQIHLEQNREHMLIVIEDTGIGIPDDLKELIFEPFFRVDKSRSRQIGGAGLGLSIVKSIIDLHHGTISIASRKGGGSRFIITLLHPLL